METERNQTSGSITVTYHTIYKLQTNTSYSIIVRATNAVGTTESTPITFYQLVTSPLTFPSTLPCSNCNMDDKSSNTETAMAIGFGGVALFLMFILALSLTLTAPIVFKRRDPSGRAENRCD